MNAVVVQHESSVFERLLMSPDAAQAILSLRFPADLEDRMRELMEKNNQGKITPDEQAEMEAYRRTGSFLAILQAKARIRLKQDNGQ
ncbi:MAG: hypothetical protein HYS13_11325 [Planctomycetia bacterium]|nr:hypothetical protein [Planctomycetia bacterium]